MNKSSKRFDQIYGEQAPESIPWNSLELPTSIYDLIKNKQIKACRAIDIGCGLGNYSRILSKMGFKMTGIDFSSVATEKAQKLADKELLSIEMYIRNVAKLLNDNAYYFTIAFNEEDDYFEGKGKFRETPTGSVLYFSNPNEIQKLFSPLFHILDLKNIAIPGKNGNHRAYYAFMQKKNAV
ncbi:class I SAM-dependent methyltransferase [Ancylomarina euxinus]|uniref:Class I SAM-dependent methyltransferase n=1 Tax=Ancylomarina euxinus TaxID=2283627 RepID=A0A425Y3S6_9BACT|nr:class I SAM-dependent methyltransferase [Ancylomarina euxinus]MCZ4694479.1 class I SAM-dependent methyltransferase [Ancylomarina euxinus]MUP14022.1 methyltransferase domain-containing protein [Ancylomarina euxinus]RRG22882.1 class I SAM-dependent methyltransferase [Ancylomarina euxinus]